MKEIKGYCCDATGCPIGTRPTIHIKIFSDYMCAWCYLADAFLASLKNRYDFELEHIGFELHTSTPENGEPMALHHPSTPQTLALINQLGAAYGLKICDLPILANTKKALIVGEYAKTRGLSDAYVHAMWRAYMVDGKNISLLSEIESAANSIGITSEEVRNALDHPKYREALEKNRAIGQSYGITSVPTFIINDEYKLSGTLRPEVFAEIFDEILANDACTARKEAFS
ncbi:MAG: DsbA family protein [Peptococcaceae bacterium]|nr:DsbA family protein [Peptococcaceae bacterium]